MELFCRRSLLYLFAILLLWVNTFSQGNTPSVTNAKDSLYLKILSEKVDSSKARKLNHLALDLRRNDPERAINYGKEARAIYEKLKDTIAMAYSNFIMGTANMNMNKFVEAYDLLNKGIRSGDKKTTARCYNNIGIIFNKQGNYSKALENYLLALRIREKENDKGDIASSFLNIGNVCYQQKNYSEAIGYYSKATTLFDKIKEVFGIATVKHNIGLVYVQQGLLDSALIYFKDALELHKTIDDKRGIAGAYESIGEVYLNRTMFTESKEYLERALVLYIETEDIDNIVEVNISLARIELLKTQLTAARKRLVENIGHKKLNVGSALLSNYYLLLSEIDEADGKYKDALKDHQLFLTYRDSSINEENTKRLIEQKMNYDFNKKEELLKQEQLKKDIYSGEQLKNQKLVTRTSIIVGSLIFILLVLSGFAYRDKKRSHQIIESQKTLVEEKQTSILDSINYAKKLQQAILPKLDVVSSYFPQNFILYLPKDIVAGDFYWVTESKDYYYLAVCDCTGHGVPGAFMSLLNIGFLSEAINERNIFEPNKILDYVRTRLIEGIGNEGQQDGMDGILMCFNKKDNKVTYASAHNAPILVRGGALKTLGVDKMPVGMGIKMDPFTLFNIELKQGDGLYFFTDGFADQFGGPRGKKYKHKHLEELLLSSQNITLKEQHAMFSIAFHNWKGKLEQVDDVLIMGIKI